MALLCQIKAMATKAIPTNPIVDSGSFKTKTPSNVAVNGSARVNVAAGPGDKFRSPDI